MDRREGDGLERPMNPHTTTNHGALRVIRKIVAIQTTLCAHFQIDLEILLKRDRVAKRAEIRQIGMYLAREMTSASSPDVAQAFNRLDHGTVLHAVGRISDLMDVDPAFNELVLKLERDANELFEVNEHARLRKLGVLV